MRWRGRVTADDDAARGTMVDTQLARRGIDDPRVLAAMRAVPRHRFVPETERNRAHGDHPVQIGHGQTVSQPHIVAMMSALLGDLPAGSRILEVGSGSGYQTAVLVHMGFEVHAIERLSVLVGPASSLLAELDLSPASVITGDGHLGRPEQAPFDAILAAAAPTSLPTAWPKQLTPSGRIVAPVGPRLEQWLRVWRLRDGDLDAEDVCRVRFVPLIPD